MKDNEIKEIIDYLIVNETTGMCYLSERYTKQLKDYITKIEEENKILKTVMLEKQFPTPNAVTVKIETKEVLQQRIEKLESKIKSLEKYNHKLNLEAQKYFDLYAGELDYKSRVNKAIEYMEHFSSDEICENISEIANNTIKLLQGDNKE